jgi:hypothetical protein
MEKNGGGGTAEDKTAQTQGDDIPMANGVVRDNLTKEIFREGGNASHLMLNGCLLG